LVVNIYSEANISVQVENAESVVFGYRFRPYEVFTKLEMFDDGNHNDGQANDGVYGVSIEVAALDVQYYIYAENNDAGLFSPERAEHEYHFLPVVGDLVINEFMASNTSAVEDISSGVSEYDDWVELYNNSNSDINLSGYFLSDDSEDIMSWQIPAGTVISAKGYLMIWADKDEEQEGLHANFKLSSSAESLILSDSDGSILDEVSYADQTTDISYGRFPNGTGDLQVMNPTFGLENNNDILTLEDAFENEKLIVYPNPTIEGFWINYNGVGQAQLSVSDLYGRVILSQSISTENWIDTKGWTSGIYLIRANDSIGKIVVR